MKTKFCLIIILSGLFFNIYAQIPTEGLVGKWSFNGNANDESGNANNGIVSGATLTTDRFGVANNAFLFDGFDDYIEIGPSESLNTAGMEQISVSAWVYVNKYNAFNRILCLANKTDNINIDLSINNAGITDPKLHNKVWFLNYSNGSEGAATGSNDTVLLNKWYHITGVMDFASKIAYLYIDDKLVSIDTGTISIRPNNPYLTFGILVGSLPQWLAFDGKLDDIRIYNRALNAQEIHTLYNEGKCFETIYETITTYDTITIYDTSFVTVYDTVKVYDSISVTDTLFIDVTITGGSPITANIVKVYPNPTNDKIIIRCNTYEQISGYQYKILNSLGSVVFQSTITQRDFEVNINEIGETGLYFLQIIDNSNRLLEVRKIILE